jgi:hypothetical protein
MRAAPRFSLANDFKVRRSSFDHCRREARLVFFRIAISTPLKLGVRSYHRSGSDIWPFYNVYSVLRILVAATKSYVDDLMALAPVTLKRPTSSDRSHERNAPPLRLSHKVVEYRPLLPWGICKISLEFGTVPLMLIEHNAVRIIIQTCLCRMRWKVVAEPPARFLREQDIERDRETDECSK